MCPTNMAKHGGNKQNACSGLQHAAGELAKKVGCWVDSGGSNCISWAAGSKPMHEVAHGIPCVLLEQWLVTWWL